MSTTNTGARSYGGKRRHGLAWLPWLALLLLGLIALAIFLLVRNLGDTDDKVGIDATDNTASSGVSGPSASPSKASNTAAAVPAGPLVGGGGNTVQSITPSGASVSITGTVLFAESSASLDSSSLQVITNAAKALEARGATAATVTGYTDVVGNTPTNDTLSQQRADAVANQLGSEMGANFRVTAVSKGEDDPVAPNENADGTDNAANRQLNRRAVIAAT